ncbi:MAG: SGNH/GDSL hydrolase family protein [Flavobacteriales bacterium]|nr:SGNH/GDSL hydrolase family protein [Flavobacteriales bacterium]
MEIRNIEAMWSSCINAGFLFIAAVNILGDSLYSIDVRNDQSIQISTMTGQQKTKTYLALGDSYTIGERVAEKDRWPVILKEELSAQGVMLEDPQIVAVTGWTTDELMAGIEKEEVADTFDLVSLLIGVNNQYRGRDVEEYRKEYNQLLDMAVRFAGGKSSNVFVLSIPDWGATPFAKDRDQQAIAREIDIYNQVKKDETVKRYIPFIDITGISRQAKSDPELIADDGLHPSGKMYKLWVDEIMKQIPDKLGLIK